MVSGFGPLACSVTGPLREDAKAEGYTLAKLPSHWKKEELGAEADAVFYSATTKSLISVNSVCDRYTDSRLETLTQDLLSPMKAVKVVHQEDLKISDRRALFTRAEGQIDGVSVQMSVIVLRKNRCLFDFSLFGTGITDAERREFMSFVQGFRYQEASR
ncbi:MAG TPA: hypothetical protein VM901_06155 [Bdellovibrionota bacterium]|nr:hypothetical protein [Bdellovibrionota bacterium]